MKLKWLHRIALITSNAARQLINPLFGFVIAYLVFKYASKDVWGNFVSFLLFVLIVSQIINWGSKEYLIREFSEKPHKINANWSRLLVSRFPLVIITPFTGLLFFEPIYIPYLFIWVFGRFLFQSAEPLIIYEKKFRLSILIEVVSFLFFLLLFTFFKFQIDILTLLQVYSVYQLLKGILYLLVFSKNISFKGRSFDGSYFKTGLPFFLLSILGFLTSKVDLYIVDVFENNVMIAEYQIISGLFLLIMSISMFLYTPFTKNIYRSNQKAILGSQRIISTIGLIIIPICLALIYFGCHYFYTIKIPFIYLIIGFFIIFPSFIYGIHVLILLKSKKENRFLRILMIGSFVNILFTYILLTFNLGILGPLIGSALAQVSILFSVLRTTKILLIKN